MICHRRLNDACRGAGIIVDVLFQTDFDGLWRLAILSIWPGHKMIVVAHDGGRHEVEATSAFAATDINEAEPNKTMGAIRDEIEVAWNALRTEINTMSWDIARRLGHADGGEAAFNAAMQPAFALVFERAGLVRYKDSTAWRAKLDAAGFNFEDIYGQVSGTLADRLGRAGFDVSKVGHRGGDQATGSGTDAAPSRSDRADRKSAQDGEGRDGGGRVPPADEVATDDFGDAEEIGNASDSRPGRKVDGLEEAGTDEDTSTVGGQPADAVRVRIADAGRQGRQGENQESDRPEVTGTRKEQAKPAGASDQDRFAAEVMRELAAVDDLFQNQPSTAADIKGVFADIDPTIEYVGDVAGDENSTFAERAEKAGADSLHLLRTVERDGAKPRDFFVFENADDVWIDVSHLSSGQGGSAIYAAVADYAFNVGKTFIGDPEGLSAKALRRRTDAMLSSALKHGTTRHLAPHPDQVDGHPKQGVQALQWTEGDDLANLQSLINVSVSSLIHHVPELARARYDFRSGTFVSSQGQRISDEMLDGWASQFERVRKARAGRNTLKRGILLNTLARAKSGERPGLLERALRQRGKLVGEALRGTFYQSERARAKAFEDELRLDENGNRKEEPSPLSREEIRKVMPKLRAELDRLDLKRVRLWQDTTGADWQGAFLTTPERGMEVIIGASLDPMKTLYHEVIHIMRSMNLFTA